MAVVRAPVNGAVLKWARETLNFAAETVAAKLHVDPRQLAAWEAGAALPTLRQAERLSDIYRQPLVSLFSDSIPTEPKWPTDYRSFSDRSLHPLSPDTKLAILDAEWRQSVAASLRSELGTRAEVADRPVSRQIDPEVLAEDERARVGPSPAEVQNWDLDLYSALQNWRKALEKIGVLVFRAKFPISDARGFSLHHDLAPTIVLNSNDYITAQIFTLFHEYAHLLLRRTGVCNDIEFRQTPQSDRERIEVFCNRFSGAYLVPKDALTVECQALGHPATAQWMDSELGQLAGRFFVSKEVVFRRLTLIGKANRSDYVSWRRRRADQWGEEAPTPERGGFAVPKGHARKILNRNGIGYVGLVLDAFRTHIISVSDVAEYLGIKTKSISDIEDVFRKRIET